MVVTGNVFNHLVFGGISSADYGIYITGEAVYNAPTRAVEMVSVPGRNGDVPIDMGHWDNIEVKYTAGTFARTSAEFAAAISNFRNAIMTLIGYQRLEDTYNPNEYRLGIFVAGLEIEPSSGGKAGEFDIIFNCKPQRWLKSGETEITVLDGDTITNPTGYASQPLLSLEGSGRISFNGYDIDIIPETYGTIDIVSSSQVERDGSLTVFLNKGVYNTGDAISLVSAEITGFNGWPFSFVKVGTGASLALYPELIAHSESSAITFANWSESGFATKVQIKAEFTAGTSELATAEATYNVYNLSTLLGTMTAILYAHYYSSPAGDRIVFATDYRNNTGDAANEVAWASVNEITATVNAESTKSVIDGTIMIDLETGDAYQIESGSYISLNKYISLPAQLPTLASGYNEFDLDNTITSLKITPRWWKL